MAALAPLTDRRILAAFAFLILFLALSLWQGWRLGGLSSDFGGDPDEGAHAVTALMMSDYLTIGLPRGQSPMAFAEHYYEAFPKVALGHYPPGYYLPAGVALALWCDPRCLIVLQCLLAAALGLSASFLVWRLWPGQGRLAMALILALAVIQHREVARVSVHVLADLLLSLLVLAAMAFWMAWLRSLSWKASFGFGFTAAVAILTKGSAMGLAALPVVALLLTRRWSDLKQLSWWAAGIPVVLLAAPWMVWSVRFTQEGFTGDSPASFFAKALGEYSTMAPWFLGWPVLILLVMSLVRSCVEAAKSPAGLDAERACLWAAFVGMQGIVMVVPSGFSPRYMLPWLVPVLLLAVLECSRWFSADRLRRAVFFAALALAVTAAMTRRDLPKDVHGFSAAVETVIKGQAGELDRAWLVSSDGRGEGALITAAAFRTPDRASTHRVILRGSKALVDTDWVESHYRPKFADDTALLAYLDQVGVDAVIVDLSMPEALFRPHETQLNQALKKSPQVWQKIASQPVTRVSGTKSGALEIYRRIRGITGATSAS